MDRNQLKFAKTDEWVHLAGDVATSGISDYAVKALTDLVFIQLPKKGQKLTQGQPFGEVESVKAVSDLQAPVNGEVIEVNSPVAENLALLSDDPYGKGWLAKVRVAPGSSTAHLLDSAAYDSYCESRDH